MLFLIRLFFEYWNERKVKRKKSKEIKDFIEITDNHTNLSQIKDDMSQSNVPPMTLPNSKKNEIENEKETTETTQTEKDDKKIDTTNEEKTNEDSLPSEVRKPQTFHSTSASSLENISESNLIQNSNSDNNLTLSEDEKVNPFEFSCVCYRFFFNCEFA